MDGMLSQDEINALLSGMDTGDASSGASDAAQDTGEILSDIERDAIGEIANISMGTSATTLYSLVNRKVNITTPVVSVTSWENLEELKEEPCVFIRIKYTVGLDGANILILREKDVKIITDLMMGGDGTNTEGELGELHLSAISEAMNQMMGSSATSLSSMLGRMIDISPPESSLIDDMSSQSGADIAPFLGGQFVKIGFRMQIDELVDSTIMQLYPVDFAKSLYEMFIGQQMGDSEEPPAPQPVASGGDGNVLLSQAEIDAMMNQANTPQGGQAPTPMDNSQMQGMGQMDPSMQGMNMGMGMNPMGMNMGMPMQQMQPMQQANIQPAQFNAFSEGLSGIASQENIGIIMDVPLEVTVELGRTRKSISDILDFAPGTIIELDKIAGEPIDVLVNGKFVAKGEVVVIEESFGIRVTEIIK